MNKLRVATIYCFLALVIPFVVFADEGDSANFDASEVYDVDVVDSTDVYIEPSSTDWDLLKSFLSTMLNAECVIDNTFSKSFKLTDGEISTVKKGNDTYYYCKNVSLQSNFDDAVLVKNLSGSFSFNPRSNMVRAKFVALFPLIDSEVHNIKISPILKNGKLDYFVVRLDDKVFKIDQSGFYMLMLSGFEFAIEHIFR